MTEEGNFEEILSSAIEVIQSEYSSENLNGTQLFSGDV
jgi:hypothetical protein